MMAEWQEILSNLAALAAAVVLGGAIGIERELRARWAGMRTHMIVSLGAALFIMAMASYPNVQSGDVSRVIQGIVAGIGFLGAGTILKPKWTVKGLTTAASIWLVAAVGVTCGLKEYVLAITTVVLALIVLEVLRQVENRLDAEVGIRRHDNRPQRPRHDKRSRADGAGEESHKASYNRPQTPQS
jgi:putative Mg2+ transporter-C (MgtC) family protein